MRGDFFAKLSKSILVDHPMVVKLGDHVVDVNSKLGSI
jgi:hypothetical protein